jgi:hypothetical protein
LLTAIQPNEIPKPTLKDTALGQVPLWVYNITIGRILHKAQTSQDPSDHLDDPHDSEDDEDDTEQAAADADPTVDANDDAEDFEVLEKVKTTAPNGVITGKAVKRNKKSAKGR